MNKNELTLQEARAMYFDDTALQLPPVDLYRMEVRGRRYYFETEETDDGETEYRFFPSVTTVCSATIPKPEQLVKWMSDMGYDNAIAYRDERAAYGTMMHTAFAQLLMHREFDFDTVDSVVDYYVNRERLYNVDRVQWANDLKSDLIGLATWIAEYNVRPLGIEMSLRDAGYQFAGTVDMPCVMSIPTEGEWGEVYKSGPNKGKPKVTKKPVDYVCIVDFKSGRKSYGGDKYCAAQLAMCEILVRSNFPELVNGKPIRLFNWSPKDWRTVPGYHLTEQTDVVSLAMVDHMLAIYKEQSKPVNENTVTTYHGKLDIENPYACFKTKTIPEIAAEQFTDDGVDLWMYDTWESLIEDMNFAYNEKP